MLKQAVWAHSFVCKKHASCYIVFDRDTLSQKVSFCNRDLLCLTQCHMASEKFDAELLHNIRWYEFLSNFLCNWHELYYSPMLNFVYLYQLIHWYLTRILTFLSKQWAPFSTMFASRVLHNVIWSQHSNVQVSIFVMCLNFAGTGLRLWQLYVAFVMTWYLAFKTSLAVRPVILGNIVLLLLLFLFLFCLFVCLVLFHRSRMNPICGWLKEGFARFDICILHSQLIEFDP